MTEANQRQWYVLGSLFTNRALGTVLDLYLPRSTCIELVVVDQRTWIGPTDDDRRLRWIRNSKQKTTDLRRGWFRLSRLFGSRRVTTRWTPPSHLRQHVTGTYETKHLYGSYQLIVSAHVYRFAPEVAVVDFVTAVIDEGWDMMEFEDLILRDGTDELLVTVSHEDRACVLLTEDEAKGLI